MRSLRKKADALLTDDHTKMAKGLDGLRQDLRSSPGVREADVSLDKYSGWLRDFDGAQSILEVPGGVVRASSRRSMCYLQNRFLKNCRCTRPTLAD